MIRYIQWLLETYAYSNIKEFCLSLCPSFKYGLQSLTLSISIVSAALNQFVGIEPVIALAMFVAVIVETWTGIRASKAKGHAFQSFKFSRCVIKVVIWYFLIYMTHSFEVGCEASTKWYSILGVHFFGFVKIAILSYFAIEYVTSILENLAVIDGKPKDTLIGVIKNNWAYITERLKRKDK